MEYEELAFYLCGVPVLEIGLNDDTDIDEMLLEKFDVDFDTFQKIAAALLPLAILAGPNTGGLNNSVRQGFGVDGVFLVKRDVEDADLIRLATSA